MQPEPEPDPEDRDEYEGNHHWDHFEDMIPDGAVAIGGWRVVQYLPPDGEAAPMVFMTVHGEPSITETVGALHNAAFLAQASMFLAPTPNIETEE
jgi:hypothetical protein